MLDVYRAGASACRINLESVIFASAALAASADGGAGGENFSQIDPNTPMTLRLADTGKTQIDTSPSVSVNGSTLTYTAATDEKLVVIATTSNGATYQYAVDGTGAEQTLDVSAVAGLPADSDFTAQAWIEKPFDDGSQLSYATEPVEVSGTTSSATSEETPDTETPETPNTPDTETPSTPDTETPSTDKNEHPDWGTKVEFAGKTMYVDSTGKTSVEITGSGQFWLREESGELATWFMIDNSGENPVFAPGSRFWVKLLNKKENSEEYSEHYNNIGLEIEERIDSDRIWIFLVGVTDPYGNEYKTFSQTVPLYIQVGAYRDNQGKEHIWDLYDIKSIFISDSEDEKIDISYLTMEYPETDANGNKKQANFVKLSLHHFSPYAIYDYLTDEEKAELNKLMENLSDEQKQQLEQQAESAVEQIKTGDEVTYFTISGLGLIMTLALGLMIKSKLNKRKFE